MILSCLKVTVILWAPNVVWTLGSRYSIRAAAVRAVPAALGAAACRGVLREAEPMGTCRAGLRLPADRKHVHAVVFGGWSVLIPWGTVHHGVPREHPSIIRIWGENSFKYAGEHEKLVRFPSLCPLSTVQGYLEGFSVSPLGVSSGPPFPIWLRYFAHCLDHSSCCPVRNHLSHCCGPFILSFLVPMICFGHHFFQPALKSC